MAESPENGGSQRLRGQAGFLEEAAQSPRGGEGWGWGGSRVVTGQEGGTEEGRHTAGPMCHLRARHTSALFPGKGPAPVQMVWGETPAT